MKRLRICRGSTLLFDDVLDACRYGQRLRGLLARKRLSASAGLLLRRCSAIHTMGMQYPIDVVFLDRNNTIVGVRESLVPNRFAYDSAAVHVLEVASGSIQKLNLVAKERLQVEVIDDE